jgi:hypothetical protein
MPTSSPSASSIPQSTTTVRPVADLYVDANLTSEALWIVTVRNDGPAIATAVVLTMTAEANAGFGPPLSDTWNCTAGASPSCTLGRLVPSEVTTVRVPLQLPACGSSVRANATAGEFDPDIGNNNIGYAGPICPQPPG